MQKMEINIVVAIDNTAGIGWLGDLPWKRIKKDMRFFQELTTYGENKAFGVTEATLPVKNRAVVMGRKTGVYKCDTYFPQFLGTKVRESPLQEENGVQFRMSKYKVNYG